MTDCDDAELDELLQWLLEAEADDAGEPLLALAGRPLRTPS